MARCPAVRRWAAPALLVALAIVPRPAQACFFYEGADDQPFVDQTALQALVRHQDGRTTLVLGARTEGYVPDLGWIVAVPQHPTVDPDTTISFVSLDAATAPTFRTRSGMSSAAAESSSAGCGGSADAEGALPRDMPEEYPQVTILGTRDAGPYTVTTLTADTLDGLRTWATDNGYPWLPSTESDFQHYIDASWFFVAAKVRPDPSEPSLIPLVLSYEGDELVVPLLLSRRDAVRDMGLVVWVVADEPVAPRGWAQVLLDERSIVADEEGSNYQDLVADAVDAAGGQGFVTEYVQPVGQTALSIIDEPTRLFLGADGWVTRLYTRIDPEDLTEDPFFVLDDSVEPVGQLHDLTQVEGGPYWGAGWRPAAGFAPIGLALLARLLRRRRA